MEQPAVTAIELPTDVIALVPMRNVVLFPHVLMPITVGRVRSLATIEHALQTKTSFGIMLQKDATVDEPGIDALCRIGTLANLVRHATAEDGTHHVICQGIERFQIEALVDGYPFIAAKIKQTIFTYSI